MADVAETSAEHNSYLVYYIIYSVVIVSISCVNTRQIDCGSPVNPTIRQSGLISTATKPDLYNTKPNQKSSSNILKPPPSANCTMITPNQPTPRQEPASPPTHR